jgi:hypothetical protein
VERIAVASKCDYIEDLLLGVFVSYIRAFASLQQSDATHVNIEFDRPSLEKFTQAFYTAAARKCWSQAFLFNTINVASTQQARNRRDIETMLESTVGEVIDSFIPWREISKAYFHAQQGVAPTPAHPVTFGEKKVHEFETDDEEDESEDEERPKLTMGEDIALPSDEDDEDDDDASVSTEDELRQRVGGDTVALNL